MSKTASPTRLYSDEEIRAGLKTVPRRNLTDHAFGFVRTLLYLKPKASITPPQRQYALDILKANGYRFP